MGQMTCYQTLLLGVILGTAAVYAVTDADILNFALNLEYLEANFYSCAAFGVPLPANLTGAGPNPTGCVKAALTPEAQLFAESLARDEKDHVAFLRKTLGSAAVPQPQLNLGTAFAATVNAALGTTLTPAFNASATDILFYLASFIFEDLGVTAYRGAARLTGTASVQLAVAKLMAAEGYHGSCIRALLYENAYVYVYPWTRQVRTIAGSISTLRSKVSGVVADVPLVTATGGYQMSAVSNNSGVYTRTPAQVIAVATLGSANKRGGFFPAGLTGNIK